MSGNRLMSIHSMLGNMAAGSPNNNSHKDSTSPKNFDESRANSVPAGLHPLHRSPRAADASLSGAIFRASSQPPIPAPNDSNRFYPSVQGHDNTFLPQQHHQFLHQQQQQQQQAPSNAQQQQQQAQHALLPSVSAVGNGHMQHAPAGHYVMHNQGSHHQSYLSPSVHEREREREQERDREEERRREREFEREREKHRERERELERERERERDRGRDKVEGNITSAARIDTTSRPHSRAHSHAAAHHHHHGHHHTILKKPKLSIISSKVFEEAKNFPEVKLGRWTYNPTIKLPFRLQVNALINIHIPRRFLEVENNCAFRRRKVWGSEIYTDDSDIAALLVHSKSNLPADGDLEVTLRVMPRLVQYKSSMKNGLRSRGWSGKHDGLSFFCENVVSVSWTKENHSKGFLKRYLNESHYLSMQTSPSSIRSVDWPAQKYRKAGMNRDETEKSPEECEAHGDVTHIHTGDAPKNMLPDEKHDIQSEAEGDETIELSIDEPGLEADSSSFIEPPKGPLVSSVPDILPTDLSSDVHCSSLQDSRTHPNFARTLPEEHKPASVDQDNEDPMVLSRTEVHAEVKQELDEEPNNSTFPQIVQHEPNESPTSKPLEVPEDTGRGEKEGAPTSGHNLQAMAEHAAEIKHLQD